MFYQPIQLILVSCSYAHLASEIVGKNMRAEAVEIRNFVTDMTNTLTIVICNIGASQAGSIRPLARSVRQCMMIVMRLTCMWEGGWGVGMGDCRRAD
jgi:hypothetical protein